MTAKRLNFSLVCLQTNESGLIAIGGFNGDHIDAVEYLAGEDASEWRRLAPLPLPLSSRGSVCFKQRVLVVGGDTTGNADTPIMLALHLHTARGPGQWVKLKPQLPRSELGGTRE